MKNRVRFDIPIPSDIITIKDIFVNNGHKLFIVGGAVRDALLGETPKDWDLATDAVPDKVEEMMRGLNLRTIATGKKFGVINVFTDEDEYEIATFRRDVSFGGSGRRPDSVKFTTIEQDVKRRDLTINALFFDIDTNEVVDLVGGVSDLNNGIIRTVGNADDRFGEDKLRVLRAIRFAGRFGSNLHSDIEQALIKDSTLEKISGERIRDEFLKGIKTTKSVSHFLSLINKFNLFKDIFKGLIVNDLFVEERDPILLLTILLRDNDILDTINTLNELKYSSGEIRGVKFLTDFTMFVNHKSIEGIYSFKKMEKWSNLTITQITKFSKLIGLDEKFVNAFINFKLTVTGLDAEKSGIQKGPEMGKWINQKEINNFNKSLSNKN